MLTQELKTSLQAGQSVLLGDLEHPNKMPFHGLMTWFNRPSDKPVGGAGGKKVVIPAEYGIPALATLKGMAVNFDSLWMDKHVVKNKIGIVEEYEVGEPLEDGATPVYVSGFIYAHDFPEEAEAIKAEQNHLGFSYETIDTPVIDGIYENEPVLVVNGDMVFSGAAILLKDKGAYTNTSLAAQAEVNLETEGFNLDKEQIVSAIIEALDKKYELKLKAEAITVVEEKAAEAVAETEVVDEVKTEVVVATEETPEVKAESVEVIDFKAMAEDYKNQLEKFNAEIEKIKADMKAEAQAKDKHQHKGFQYPTTLASKYNLKAEADTYESQITAVDARGDLTLDEKMALKWELRDKQLKVNR